MPSGVRLLLPDENPDRRRLVLQRLRREFLDLRLTQVVVVDPRDPTPLEPEEPG